VHRSGLPHIIVQPRKSVQDTCADGDKIAGLTPEAKSAALADASCPLAGYVSPAMANRFGVILHPVDVRWAAAECVSETVIAAVLLLHVRSVDDIAPQLSATELEQVITLVGRVRTDVGRPRPSGIAVGFEIPQVASLEHFVQSCCRKRLG
jgi:hypothetical protein